ncbi:MAG: 30S ribosomal protein S12 methylthiotransferase RimO [Candidatus Sumerlaeaceae bacterium]|nr:30S ribosomal protein S12 methylthiotransferase RimO [Candidatus Sumerlaeaceae bacterium]
MRIAIVTLGCDKNTVDSEYLAGLLAEQGVEAVAAGLDPNPGDIFDAVLINTCGFIDSAKEQSINTILAWLERKQEAAVEGYLMRVFVGGCLTQRYRQELAAELPEVDGFLGVGDFEKVAQLVAHGQIGGHVNLVRELPDTVVRRPTPRKELGVPRPYAYLKIADGCNHHCTFCAIPSFKGRLRSVPREVLCDEARRLLARGACELCLVAQDTSDYGKDLYGADYGIAELLTDLAALPGTFWIRLHYFYPGGITEKFIEAFASSPKIVPYLDVPLQHLHPDILRLMKRPHRSVNIERALERLRKGIPSLAIRTTFIVGFPGEEREHFRYLLEGIKRLRFERLGAFAYSHEEGTPATKLTPQVSPATRRRRYDRLMRTQALISGELNRQKIGKTLRVLVEAQVDDDLYLGRTEHDAPEVDGAVIIRTKQGLAIGQFVDVRVTDADTYDLYAEV